MATSKKTSKRAGKSKPAKGLKTLGVKDSGQVKGGFIGGLIKKVSKGVGTSTTSPAP